MVTQQTQRVQTHSREEAESILWAPVRRGWERESMSQFPDYDIQPLVAPTQIPNPLAQPAPVTEAFVSQSQFQTYIKPGQKVEVPPTPILEKIAEFEVVPEAPVVEQVAFQEQEEVEYSRVRLNARGFVAIAAFFATVVLVTVLIIVNATSIASSGARISTLRNENASLRANVNQAVAYRNGIYNTTTGNIQNDFESQAGSNQKTIQGEEFTELPPAVSVPRTNNINRQNNSDRSTNWFDRLSRWLSNLFR